MCYSNGLSVARHFSCTPSPTNPCMHFVAPLRAPAAANGLGISRLAASTLAGHNSSNQSVVQAAAAGLAAVAAGQKQQDTSSYAVRSMLGLGSRCQRLDFDDDSEGFSIKQLPWDACNILQQDEVGCDYKLAAAGQLTAGVTHDSLDWFEQQLAQVGAPRLTCQLAQ